jgi:hypothetical protein
LLPRPPGRVAADLLQSARCGPRVSDDRVAGSVVGLHEHRIRLAWPGMRGSRAGRQGGQHGSRRSGHSDHGQLRNGLHGSPSTRDGSGGLLVTSGHDATVDIDSPRITARSASRPCSTARPAGNQAADAGALAGHLGTSGCRHIKLFAQVRCRSAQPLPAASWHWLASAFDPRRRRARLLPSPQHPASRIDRASSDPDDSRRWHQSALASQPGAIRRITSSSSSVPGSRTDSRCR